MKSFIFVIFIFFSSFAWSIQDTIPVDGSENLILKEKNAETGIYDTAYNTKEDSTRLSLLYKSNLNVKKMDGLTSLEANFAKKINPFWWEFSIQKTSARFECLTKNNENIPSGGPDLYESNTGMLTFGTGLSFRSTVIEIILNEVINADRFFETTGAMITYNRFTDSYREKLFVGPGLQADYGIHYRSSPFFHIGPRFSYNLALVKKAAENETETSNQRSLTLSWFTLGIDLSFYF